MNIIVSYYMFSMRTNLSKMLINNNKSFIKNENLTFSMFVDVLLLMNNNKTLFQNENLTFSMFVNVLLSN